MEGYQEILLHQVEGFVAEIFKSQLPEGMYFHNFEHTQLVVKGVEVISRKNGLSEDEQFVLIIAAFLHDIGYSKIYTGHEQVSAEMAAGFLAAHGAPPEMITRVGACIMATRYPQQPKTAMEMTICDADFYHFALNDYLDFADRLKHEWEEKLGMTFSDQEWNYLNIKFLTEHRYFTDYGKNKLQPKKEENIQKLKARIG